MVDIKNVLVLYTGGTIGMKKNQNNVYLPCGNTLCEFLKTISEVHDPELENLLPRELRPNQLVFKRNQTIILHEMRESDPLLDSSNMSTQEWIQIARDIEANYADFDGFVVLHGTDTLAYTSSALSFLLEKLQKPVILTGSQQHSDAKNNILYSLILAGCYRIPEVAVFFYNKLIRGNRMLKISSVDFDAFDSPNYPLLAEVVKDEIIVHEEYWAPSQNRELRAHTELNPNVGIFTIHPTITASILRSAVQKPTEGLVILSYGAGNIPSNKRDILQVFQEAVDEGVVIINVTQCSRGAVLGNYETGRVLEDLGVISGGDMKPEAALTKLSFVLGLSGLTHGKRVAMMRKSIRGEVTEGSSDIHQNNIANNNINNNYTPT